MLPSGPGGVGGITSRRTRHLLILAPASYLRRACLNCPVPHSCAFFCFFLTHGWETTILNPAFYFLPRSNQSVIKNSHPQHPPQALSLSIQPQKPRHLRGHARRARPNRPFRIHTVCGSMPIISPHGIFGKPLQRITPCLLTLGSYSSNGYPGLGVSEAFAFSWVVFASDSPSN